jgi:2-keto-4-pentenoate hydratase
MKSHLSGPKEPLALTEVGRPIYGTTLPGSAIACERQTPLTDDEVHEVVELVARAREHHQRIELPQRLRTRHWDTITRIVLELDARRALPPVGWKIGAASETVRQAEGVPYPSPGRLYEGAVFPSGSTLPSELFINYRNNECEFAFYLDIDLAPREETYTEDEVAAAIRNMVLAIEIGDTVFPDWYGVSSYLGSSLDNGGGAALVHGDPILDWRDRDLPNTHIDLYLNDTWVKSGEGKAAMGHPLTSLTWLVNWLSSRGITLHAGEIVSTGTCTGHCFAAPGDEIRAVFNEIGEVTVRYA